MDNQCKDSDLANFLEYQLPIFDELLAEEQMPLHQRPFAATIQFVTYCIVAIEGDDKDNFLEKAWFKSFYQLVSGWYSNRYGDAMKLDRDDSSLGVVLIYDTPFKMKIPLSIPGKKESAIKRWFCLPNEVLEKENVFDWIVKPPNLNKMSPEELSSLKTDLRTVANATRSIRVNLMTATLKENDLRKLSSGIPPHIEKSVRDILSLDAGRISNSIWEIHLAIEKSLKLLIRQRGHVPPNVHDLEKLCKIASDINDVFIDSDLINNLPSHQESIRHRYGEVGLVTVGQAVSHYKSALNILNNFTHALSRQFIMKNAEVLIQVPPWAR